METLIGSVIAALIGVAGMIATIFINKRLSEKKAESELKVLLLPNTQPIKRRRNRLWMRIAVATLSVLAFTSILLINLPVLPKVLFAITPTSLPDPSPTIDPCKNFVSRVYKGEKVHTANILDKNLNIRKLPSLSAPIITSVKNGTEFQILNGPVCADTLMWWEASTTNGSVKGWIAEVNINGTYYIQP